MISFPSGSVLIFLCFGLIGTLMVVVDNDYVRYHIWSVFHLDLCLSSFALDSLVLWWWWWCWEWWVVQLSLTHWWYFHIITFKDGSEIEYFKFQSNKYHWRSCLLFPFLWGLFWQCERFSRLARYWKHPFLPWLLNSRPGFGSSALLVASFGSAQIAAIEAGFPESMEVQ